MYVGWGEGSLGDCGGHLKGSVLAWQDQALGRRWWGQLLADGCHLHHGRTRVRDAGVHEVALEVLDPVLLHGERTLEDQVAEPDRDTHQRPVDLIYSMEYKDFNSGFRFLFTFNDGKIAQTEPCGELL